MTLHVSIDISDSNIHLLFSVIFDTSMSSIPLALLRCMVHYSQVLFHPSSIIIMIHTSLRVFDKLTFVTILYVDVDEYIFMSSIRFKVEIDIRHRCLIFCSSFSFDEILLVIRHKQICSQHCHNNLNVIYKTFSLFHT
jgi:hypothetical protein